MPNRFFQEGGRFAGETSPPFPPGYGPVSNSFKVQYVQHICTEGPKTFLASYGPGFAP